MNSRRPMVIIVFLMGFLLGLIAHAQDYIHSVECSDQGKVGNFHLMGTKPKVRFVITGSQKSYEIVNPGPDLKSLLELSIRRDKMVYFENGECHTHTRNNSTEILSSPKTEWELLLRDQ